MRYRSRGEETQRFLVGEDNLTTWLELVELMAKGESPPPGRVIGDASPAARAQAPAGSVAGLDPFTAFVTGALLLTGLTVAERPLAEATPAAGAISAGPAVCTRGKPRSQPRRRSPQNPTV